MKQGGCDLNRIDNIDMIGFIKIAIIEDFVKQEEIASGLIQR